MSLKETLLHKCKDFVNERKHHLDEQMEAIKIALLEESKSSAGDKHETGRAMLQLEREKISSQYQSVNDMFETLGKINLSGNSNMAHLGSIVFTTKANYFIAIGAGELKIKDETFYAISPSTPMGRLLVSKTEGDEVFFRDQKFVIDKIV